MSIRTATLALLALSTSAFAADSPADREGHRAEHMERLATLLDLDDHQKTQVQAILEEQHQKRKAVHEQREATRTETLEKLRPVLSEAQIKKFEALGGERRGRRYLHCEDNQK